MLQTILKVSKAAESVDWESVKSKYSDIRDLLVDALPDEITPGSFPHKKEEITKQVVTSKLKAIRLKFRQAVDSGRRSGHGRVVMLFYELCERVWGGSPATKQIKGGIESSELVPDVPPALPQEDATSAARYILSSIDRETSSSDANTPSTSGNLPVSRDISIRDSSLARSWINEEPDTPLGGESNDEEETEPESNTGDDDPMKKSVQQRRQFLDDKLKNYKQEKMKRKLPVDSQLLGCAQEELKIKRQLVERMDKMDQKYAESIERMSNNVEKLTESIADGFELLKQLMCPQPSGPPPHVYHHQPMFNPSAYNVMQGSTHAFNTGMSSYQSSSSTPPP